MTQFEELRIKVSSKAIKNIKAGLRNPSANVPPFYNVGKWLLSNSLARRLARRIQLYEQVEYRSSRVSRLTALLSRDQDDAQSFGSPYGYSDDLDELKTAVGYSKRIANGIHLERGSTGKLFAHHENILADLISEWPVSSVLNFGVSYAHVDTILAKRFPIIQFVGIDRSEFTKFYNETCFSDVENIEFINGDIFQLLEERRFDNGVFFHARTLTLLPPEFIQKLYGAVRDAGFSHIVCMEPVGISRATVKPYEFSEDEQASVPFRDRMFIHNYPGCMKKAGYSVSRAELLRTDHPHEDVRILSITGSLSD